MADPTAHLYSPFFLSAFNKEIDIDSDTFKVILLDDTYTPDRDNHRYKSDLAGEISGAGYTAGGAVVSPLTLAYDAGGKNLSFDGVDATWDDSTITSARYAAIYDDTPATDAAKCLVGYVDFGEDKSTSDSPFGVTWNANGIASVTIG